MGAAGGGGVTGWEFEIGALGERTTSTSTSISGDGMVIWAMSLLPVTDLTASGALAPDVLLSFSPPESPTIAVVERRAVVDGVPGAWSQIGSSGVDTGEYLDENPGSGTWQYRVRTAGGYDANINLSRSAYSATVQVTLT